MSLAESVYNYPSYTQLSKIDNPLYGSALQKVGRDLCWCIKLIL